MFGSGMIELVIGLILIYFLLSLLCSGINEVAEHVLKRRADFLEAGLVNLLGKKAKTLLNTSLIKGLAPGAGKPSTGDPADATAQGQRTEASVSNGSLRQRLRHRKTMPSYIPSRTFSLALLTALADQPEPSSKTPVDIPGEVEKLQDAINKLADEGGQPALADTLNAFLADAGNDLEKWKKNVENWFDDAMDRVSGWYKRRTKWWLLLWGLLIVGILNADTIAFARTLWTNDTVRASVVAQAEQTVQNIQVQPSPGASAVPAATPQDCPVQPSPSPSPSGSQTPAQVPSPTPLKAGTVACITEQVKNIKDLGLPLGWNPKDPGFPVGYVGYLLKALGLLLTALALTLGAPFWFDLLNKFVNFRASGSPPGSTSAPPPPSSTGGTP